MSAAHQLATSGSVFFAYQGHLYLHDFAQGMSVRLDVAHGVAEPPVGGAKFLYAAADGSRVLFRDSQQLTSAGAGGVYECRIVETDGVPGCELSLTPLPNDRLFNGGKDATYLYFENSEEKLIVANYEDGLWTTKNGPYIGSMPESNGLNLGGFGASKSEYALTEPSPDGRYFTFMSSQELTGYNNRDAASGQRDVEVYLYDAVTNRLACASCDPTGARPVGAKLRENELNLVSDGVLGGGKQWVAADLPPWNISNGGQREGRYQPRFMADSGRLFFNSHDALVPQDVNGQQDVYEFEPPGVGDCTSASATYSSRSDGCVDLISAGTSAEESAFMDASESGGDVFFITLSKLTLQDFDNALDVYDAHECTTVSSCPPVSVAPPPACSSGDGCKPAPTPQPSIFGEPASATFTGRGNTLTSGQTAVPRKTKLKPLSRAQKLARALVACRKQHGKQRRVRCERGARKRYGKSVTARKTVVRHGDRG